MGLEAAHPQYAEYSDEWSQMRDSYEGERKIKSKGTLYLPATSGMVADGFPNTYGAGTSVVSGPITTVTSNFGTPGYQAYLAYRNRAVFPDVVKAAVEAMLGVMHQKPPTIELPPAMEPLMEKATLRNESLSMLLRRINEEQLVTGRVGLMLDLPEKPQTGKVPPYIALYQAHQVLNWDVGTRDGLELQALNLVVLDESEFERQDNFQWEMVNKYRALVLGDIQENVAEGAGIYSQGVFRESEDFSVGKMTTPVIGGQAANFIPFTFINSKDIVAEPDQPPLLGLANLALTIYRGEADYRQSLFMQGQDTLVVIGGQAEEDYRTGANASIGLPSGGDAKYIGVDSSGITEQREALQNDYNRAAQKGGELLDSVSRERESGDALQVRVAARTATLNQLAMAGAFGLQNALRQAATWMGLNPEEVLVTPNLDFIDDTMGGKELTDLMTAKNLGAPLSQESIHVSMQNRGLTDLTYEEELALIEEEEPLGGMASSNPDDLDDEPVVKENDEDTKVEDE